MEKTRKLVLFGDSAFAEIAREYFDHDSSYEVVAFTVTSEYLREPVKDGLPVVPFERVAELYPPDEHDLHVALVYNQLNRPRMRFYAEAKALGYTLANYVSSRAFVWRNVTIGDNVFIFEDNTVQPFVSSARTSCCGAATTSATTRRCATTRSSRRTSSSRASATIGACCFFGVNSTVGNNVTVGADCLIGSGALIVRDVEAGSLLKGPMTRPEEITTWEKLGVEISGDALRRAS